MGVHPILGELAKLGIRKIGRTTVQNILDRNGFDLGPKRGRGTWDEFVKRHAKTLYACDFLSVRSWTNRGLVDLYLLFFIHIDSRRVFLSNATANPNAQWVDQQARNFCIELDDQGMSITHFIRDRDNKFTDMFDTIIQSRDADRCRLPIRSPNLNAYAERFVQTLKHEALDHFMIFGEKHLNYLTHEFVSYYHQRRPHQGKDNKLLLPTDSSPPTEGEVVCEQCLGGLLKHYYRKAA